MKKLFVILLLTISINGIAQTKDSTVRTADSIPTITVADINAILTFYYDKNLVSPKDYDMLRQFKDVILNYTEPRRLAKVKKK